MPVIAITGGVGSGKSTAAEYFKDLGAIVFSADVEARNVLQPGNSAFAKVVAAFGRSYLQPNGNLDRRRLGDLVFADVSARKRLEEITHPAIYESLRQKITDVQRANQNAIVMVEIPLLYETGTESAYDAVIAVTSTRDVQARRLGARDSLGREDVEKRIKAQLPMEEKAARADYLIQNNGNRDALKRAVRTIWKQIALSGTESSTKTR